LVVYRYLLRVCRSLLRVYRALLRVYRALLSVYRALFNVDRALLGVNMSYEYSAVSVECVWNSIFGSLKRTQFSFVCTQGSF